jgi:DNA-directed RNA polymerase specialized sigma24 family protein
MSAPHDECYELFRRAIVERDQSAWAQIHAHYRVLLIAWARQSSVSLLIPEQLEDIADQALARAWSALTPARFVEFPELPALLAYLRTCVATVLIDMARAEATRTRTLQKLSPGAPSSPEEIVIDAIEQAALWRIVSTLIVSPQEDLIVRQNIVRGVPPRALLARRPDLFRSIDEVYATKRNLIGRLQRNQDLQRFVSEMRDA